MSKRLLANIILLITVRVLLDFSYVYYVVPVYAYSGYKLQPAFGQYCISWIIYLLVFPITPVVLRRVSDAVFVMVTVLIVAPLSSMYGLSGASVTPIITTVISMYIVYGVVRSNVIPVVRMPFVKNGKTFAIVLSLAAVGVVTLHYLYSGVTLNMNLLAVYNFRSQNAALASSGAFSYLNQWAFSVFNLFLIAVALRNRKYFAIAALLGVQIFLFMASQHKVVLFAPIVILGVWWYLRRSASLLVIPFTISCLLAITLLMYLVFDYNTVASLAIRRTFFDSASLDFTYFSFFSSHPKFFWAGSFWMPFVHSPYPVGIPYVIGRYLGSQTADPNNGYISSGFAQAGFLGVFIYTFVLAYVLKFVDVESRHLNAVWFGVALFLLPFMIIWSASDLLTSMLTHGFLVMLILLALMREPTGERVRSASDRARRVNGRSRPV